MTIKDNQISKEDIRKFVEKNKSKILKEAKEVETAIKSNRLKNQQKL
ncbi:hypothetical protein [Microbulbifer sp. THAF38]|nr:hypothetical protein [Microbulbifer sp. THAF38]QFT53081.1 hypothetical protein FIU95_00605 [Microbulbifer sp. THAF38]